MPAGMSPRARYVESWPTQGSASRNCANSCDGQTNADRCCCGWSVPASEVFTFGVELALLPLIRNSPTGLAPGTHAGQAGDAGWVSARLAGDEPPSSCRPRRDGRCGATCAPSTGRPGPQAHDRPHSHASVPSPPTAEQRSTPISPWQTPSRARHAVGGRTRLSASGRVPGSSGRT